MLSYSRDQRLFVWLMLLPAFAVMACFFIWPSVYNVINSFTDLSLLGLKDGGDWVGFKTTSACFTMTIFGGSFSTRCSG